MRFNEIQWDSKANEYSGESPNKSRANLINAKWTESQERLNTDERGVRCLVWHTGWIRFDLVLLNRRSRVANQLNRFDSSLQDNLMEPNGIDLSN